MKKLFCFMMLLCVYQAYGQMDEETEFAYSCSLSIKTTVFPPDTGDKTGRGYIEALLCDKNGVPIANKEVKIVTSCGMLSCQAPGWYDDISSISSDRSCFMTGADGRIQVYLANVPFNTQGRIKATSACDEITVTATGSFMISRKSTKKRTKSRR
jgi:hypothetical protein